MEITTRRPRVARVLAAILATLALVLTGALTSPAAAQPAATTPADAAEPGPPEITRTVSDAGFAHPGVGVSADHLENMRAQVAAGVEPWASYEAAMRDTRYAALDFRAENAQPGTDTPKDDAYASVSMRSMALRDGIGALTQALMYVTTGDDRHRANALHVLRTWSGLDPDAYAYFADAHIHTGVPLYYMLMAAEIIRATEPNADTLDGYELRWTQGDQQRIETNLVRPVLETFLSSPNRLWNQHLYGVIGMIAAAVFLDDADLYAERVEWFTVNAGYTSEHDLYGGDVNGAVAALFPLIAADAPGNTTGEAFVQHREMLRDQAHGQGDIDLSVAIARLIDVQGTRLDPAAGTVSTAASAVSPYRFLDDRILAAADTFVAFMRGDEVPYIPATEGGTISQAYRGRLLDPLSETYLQYTHVAGVDVAANAPHVAALYEQRDGPLTYNGAGVMNFWNERGSDYTGAEYWVAFPEALAADADPVAPLTDGPELRVDRAGLALGGTAVSTDADGTVVATLDAADGDGGLALRRAVWSARTDTALVGVRVRTDETGVLELRRTVDADPFATVVVPDTAGAWRYVWVDLDQRVTPGAVGDNIVFLRADTGRIDVAGLLAQANGVLTPPRITTGPAAQVVAVAGEPWTHRVEASTGAALAVQGAGEVPILDGDVLRHQPSQPGSASFLLVADDGETVTAQAIALTVTADRQAAIDTLLAGVGDPATYTSASWLALAQARGDAVAVRESADPAAFAEALARLGAAVAALAPLNPVLADGSLDYGGLVTAPALTAAQLAALTDGDNQTTWGDQRVSAVVFDFGPGFRVRADAFGFLARDTFANRAEGTNAYGSDDGTTWTLLTEHPNAGQDAAIERVPVRADARDLRFRFVKFQVDEPGIPSDPAYPGIWSIADIRIEGTRSEAVGAMDAVTLGSPDAVAGRVVPGDLVRVDLAGPADATDVTVEILGQPAGVTSPSPGVWVAELAAPDGLGVGQPVGFVVRFRTADGRVADPIAATTDGSALTLSSDDGLLDGALAATATVLRPDGVADAAWAQHAARMLDGDPATHSDNRLNAGVYGHVWDLGADHRVSLTRAELLVRQDGYGTSRIADLRLEGSNDLQEWTRLTPAVPARTLSWQPWESADASPWRYLRIANGQILGVAELRLFGEITEVDAVPPVVTVKPGATFTVPAGDDYRMVSYKLHDPASGIDRLTLNGVEKDLVDNPWSDLNHVVPGAFGAVLGENTLVVRDAAGNATTVTFTLVE